jgi:Tol biopolymer transport system component
VLVALLRKKSGGMPTEPRDEMSGTTSLLAIALGICLGSETQQSAATVLTVPQRDGWRSASSLPAASLSADGRWIAFESYARLAPADTNNHCDVYVLDRTNGRVTLESITTDGDPLPGHSTGPRLSGEGRHLVFETAIQAADGMVHGSEIVLRDRLRQTTRRVSRGPSSMLQARTSRHAAISDDGRIVVFASSVTDLVAGRDENGQLEDVYLFDVATDRTRRVSVDRQGVQLADGASYTPSVNADGRYVAFTSTAALDGVPPRLLAGRPIASVFVRDTQLGVTERVNVTTAGAPDGHSSDPAISRDGRYVAFASEATNLVRGDRNRSADVFLRNLHNQETTLISRGMNGGAANGPSGHPIVSGDGRFVAFQSLASDLLCTRRCAAESEDINLLWDVFRFDRMTGSMTRISGGPGGGWAEESSSPQFDASGEIAVFSSRHPIDAQDVSNDFDLFVRIGTPAAAITRRH